MKVLNEEYDESRAKALADYLGVDVDTIRNTYDNTYETEDGEEYLVVDEDEAYGLAKESIESYIDELGISGFTEGFQDWIKMNALDADWFEDALRESEEFYVDDIESESSNTYANRLIEEMVDAGILDESDLDEDGLDVNEGVDIYDKKSEYVDYLVENAGDPFDWYVDNFGEEELDALIKEGTISIDTDAIVDEAIDLDGIAHFIATYDGDEIELDDGWYAYRTN